MSRLPVPARNELIKLTAQVPIQVLVVLVMGGPIAFAAVLSGQAGTPADAVLGNWVHGSGAALSLVLLSFAGNWGAPVIAGVLAGDLFASEDRQRTWKTLLSGFATVREIFVGKVLAAGLLAVLLGVALAASSIIGGLAFVGIGQMPDLSGQLIGGAHLVGLLIWSWLLTLLPLLAFTSVAILVSVTTSSAIVAVLAPVLLGLVDQLLTLTGNGTWLHLLLPIAGFTAWTGIFNQHSFYGPIVVSQLASVAWIVICLGAAWRSLSRRDFAPAVTRARGRGLLVPLRIAAVGGTVLALAVFLTTLGPAGVRAGRLTTSLADTFRRLTVEQQDLLGHPIPAGSTFTIRPLCNKRGARPVGPGDWDCTVNVYVLLPGGAQPLTDTPVDYDVGVSSDGCYKAEAPAQIVGGQTIRLHSGRRVINPLTVIYGCFDVL